MKTKNILKCMAAALMASVITTSCNNSPKEADNAPAESSEKGELRIAYFIEDSLNTCYNFCVEKNKQLQTKTTTAENTIKQKKEQLQKNQESFQQKLQSNVYKSQDEFDKARNSLIQQEIVLNQLAERLQNELLEEQRNLTIALHDSINNFLNDYNKTKKYDFIIARSSMIYGNEAYDITMDIINGLNKRYKPAKKDTKK